MSAHERADRQTDGRTDDGVDGPGVWGDEGVGCPSPPLTSFGQQADGEEK